MMIRVLYQGGVVLFFLVMMTLLFQREIIPRSEYGSAIPLQSKKLAESWVDIDETMSVYFNDFPIGIIKQQVKQNTTAEGIKIQGYEGRTVFLLRGGIVNAELFLQTQMNAELEMTNFSVSFKKNSEQVMDVYGRMNPDRNLALRIDAPQGKKFRKIKLKNRPTFNLASTNILEQLKAQPNNELQMNVYDPIWGVNSEAARFRLGELQSIKIEGKEVFASVVEMNVSSVKTTMFFGPLNNVIRREIQFSAAEKNENSSVQALPSFKLRMDQTSTNPLLKQVTELINDDANFLQVTTETMNGTDEGDVPGLFNLSSLLMQQSFSNSN